MRYHYWAKVRMPPERRLPPDTQEIVLPSGAIQPLQPAQRQDAPAAYSLPSASAMAMRVPAQLEELDAGMVTATLLATPGGWRLAIAIGGPEAHARAVGLYKVQMHVERATGVLSQEDEQELAAGALTWQVAVPGTVPAMVRVALVLIDPVGRAPAPLFLDVAN